MSQLDLKTRAKNLSEALREECGVEVGEYACAQLLEHIEAKHPRHWTCGDPECPLCTSRILPAEKP